METIFNETVTETSDLQEMRNKYLAEKLLRKWEEDFTDEETGNVVTIERKELLFPKGTLLDEKTIAEINFFLQSGDIKSVKVSNVPRPGTAVKSSVSVYVVTVEISGKKHNYYLYANSVPNSIEIATDYLEQTILGGFSFVGVKVLKYSNLIPEPEEPASEADLEAEFYYIEIENIKDNCTYFQTYILRAKNAEDAKNRIEQFIYSRLPEEEKHIAIETTIISAKTINCDNVIDYRFSQIYFENQDK